jgi:hypothetical protein
MRYTRYTCQLFREPGGPLLADWSTRLTKLTFAYDTRGCADARVTVPMRVNEALRFADRVGTPHLVITASPGGDAAWAGRLEDIGSSAQGLEGTAFGYYRALSDVSYTALYSSTSTKDWEAVIDGQIDGHSNSRFDIQIGDAIRIAPRKGEVFGTSIPVWGGSVLLQAPSGGARPITGVVLRYRLFAPSGWIASVAARDADLSYTATPFVVEATGTSEVAGTATITLTQPCAALSIELRLNTAGPTEYAGETGDAYLLIESVRVITAPLPITPTAVLTDLLGFVTATNPGQLRSSVAGIGSGHTIDLTDASYADELPSAIIDTLLALADAQGRYWEVVVGTDRRLRFRPRGTGGRVWFADVDDFQVSSSIDELNNSVYGVFKDASGRTLRTQVSEHARSIGRYGLRRRHALAIDTTELSVATTQRDAHLRDRATPRPQAAATVTVVRDRNGIRVPPHYVLPGDTLVIQNLSHTAALGSDRARVLALARTEVDATNGTLSFEPDAASPSLETVLAGSQPGRGGFDPARVFAASVPAAPAEPPPPPVISWPATFPAKPNVTESWVRVHLTNANCDFTGSIEKDYYFTSDPTLTKATILRNVRNFVHDTGLHIRIGTPISNSDPDVWPSNEYAGKHMGLRLINVKGVGWIEGAHIDGSNFAPGTNGVQCEGIQIGGSSSAKIVLVRSRVNDARTKLSQLLNTSPEFTHPDLIQLMAGSLYLCDVTLANSALQGLFLKAEGSNTLGELRAINVNIRGVRRQAWYPHTTNRGTNPFFVECTNCWNLQENTNPDNTYNSRYGSNGSNASNDLDYPFLSPAPDVVNTSLVRWNNAAPRIALGTTINRGLPSAAGSFPGGDFAPATEVGPNYDQYSAWWAALA